MSTNRTELPLEFRGDRHAREWMSGFLLLGVLVGLLGSLLIAWQYHIESNPQLIGLHFLALSAGYVLANVVAQRMALKISLRALALLACGVAFASLLALSFLVPPAPPWWRIFCLLFVGFASGCLTTALLYALEPYFSEAPARVANLAGLLFGSGCLVATLIVGMTYYAGSVQIETALLAIVPVIYFVIFSSNKFPGALHPVRHDQEANKIRENLRHVRSVAAVLFGLLLFVQFGNEWAIAGWLPLFLIHRLGANPVWAISALAIYFLSLMLGRLVARRMLLLVDHRRLLMASILIAMAGYLLLSFATWMPTAYAAVITIGAGFAPIYPLIAENLDDRFSYHPGFYNGIFSVAITGAMFAPWILGYVDAYLGIQYVMLVPAFGSIAVLILALLIMLEAHLMGARSYTKPKASAATAGKD